MVSMTSFMLFILFVIYVAGTGTGQCEDREYLKNGTTCQLCPNRCNACINFKNCTTCKMSYNWGKACEYDCNGCYENCDKDHGCFIGCDSNYYKSYDKNKGGYICKRCPRACLECSNETLCSSCNTEHWGGYCQYNCTGCSSSCNKNKGCIASCISGYYHQKLDKGSQCRKCPNTCKDNNCDKTSGKCENGCQSGWFGEKCTSECNTACKETICFQHNGTCVYGHVDDDTGIITTTVTIGIGAGAAVVIALVIVVIVLVIRRRRATRTRKPSEDTIDVVKDNNTQGQCHATYATVNKQPSEAKHVEEVENTPPKNDVTYATVNKQPQTTINVAEDSSRPRQDDTTYAVVNKK